MPKTTVPKTPEDLLAYLDQLGVATTTVEHPPLHTVEDSRALRGIIPGGHTKNLFLKDKKGRLFLLTLGETDIVDLKRVHEKIGAQGRVSFGSAEQLEEVWGVRPGAVTPFGAINDHEGRVTVVLDAGLMRACPAQFSPARQHAHDRPRLDRPGHVSAGHRPRADDRPARFGRGRS